MTLKLKSKPVKIEVEVWRARIPKPLARQAAAYCALAGISQSEWTAHLIYHNLPEAHRPPRYLVFGREPTREI